ncbi:MAG: hypothetical protein JWP87_5629, partial [Labilithrix sp.]|nr:hypothetical protein [Labilithrix sp.]
MVDQEVRLRHLAWFFFVFFALFAPLGCGQGDRTAPAPAENVGSAKQAFTVVDTTPGSGASNFDQFSAWGQTITVPAGETTLLDFSFSVRLPAVDIVRGEVYAWSGSAATGPNLYESGPISTTSTATQTLTFNTGGIPVTPGAQYVIFLTRARDASPAGFAEMDIRTTDVYPGGNFWLFNSGTNFTGTSWSQFPNFELAFTARFGTPPATTTTVASSSNPSVFGQSVTVTASVASASGTPTTGSVTFKDGATVLGTVNVDGAGQASVSTAALGVGAHSITATYGGALSYAASTSAALTQTVSKATTTAALSSSVNPTITGGSTTFTATVSVSAPGAGTPTGTATFKDGATVLGSSAISAAGVATLSTSALSVGTHSITVDYSGDASFAGSTSPAVSQVVNQDGASVAVTSSVNPSTFGSATIFTATVKSVDTGATPGGLVTFKDGATALATVAVNGSGVATLSVSTLTGGAHTINADYAGDSKHTAATGSVTQNVNVGASTTALTSLTNPSVFGQSVTLKATVSGTGATATGTITFSEGGTTLGTGTLAAGSAT